MLPVAFGAAAIAVRLAVLPAAPPPPDRPPEGDGPWRMVVESVGSPRDGKQTATLATTATVPRSRSRPRFLAIPS
jgi:hypothetical protein